MTLLHDNAYLFVPLSQKKVADPYLTHWRKN